MTGHHLADQASVALQDLKIARGRGVGIPVVGRDHAKQVAGRVDERRRLDGAEGSSRGGVPVRREARVGVDVGDDGLGALLCRPPARRPVVIDHGEVVKKLGAETVLDGDPQRAGGPVEDLDIAQFGAGQVQRPFESPGEERPVLGDLAQVSYHPVQPPRHDRLIQIETGPRGELLGLPGQILPAKPAQPTSGAAVQSLRFLKQPAEFPVLARPRQRRKRLGPSEIIPESIHGQILPRR